MKSTDHTWLRSVPANGLSWLRRSRRSRLIRNLWTDAGILCDASRYEVLTAQDLDCHVAREGFEVVHDRVLRVSKQLPFSLAGEDTHLTVKALARWSLCSQALQHPIVAEVCKSEATRRTGRCRVMLLEVVGKVGSKALREAADGSAD